MKAFFCPSTDLVIGYMQIRKIVSFKEVHSIENSESDEIINMIMLVGEGRNVAESFESLKFLSL